MDIKKETSEEVSVKYVNRESHEVLNGDSSVVAVAVNSECA